MLCMKKITSEMVLNALEEMGILSWVSSPPWPPFLSPRTPLLSLRTPSFCRPELLLFVAPNFSFLSPRISPFCRPERKWGVSSFTFVEMPRYRSAGQGRDVTPSRQARGLHHNFVGEASARPAKIFGYRASTLWLTFLIRNSLLLLVVPPWRYKEDTLPMKPLKILTTNLFKPLNSHYQRL